MFFATRCVDCRSAKGGMICARSTCLRGRSRSAVIAPNCSPSDQSRWRALPHDRHGERLQCDFGVQRLAHRPADDLEGVQIPIRRRGKASLRRWRCRSGRRAKPGRVYRRQSSGRACWVRSGRFADYSLFACVAAGPPDRVTPPDASAARSGNDQFLRPRRRSTACTRGEP